MTVIEFLDKFAAEYTLEEQGSSVCVEEISARSHGAGVEAAKCVVVRVDGKQYMCVLPVYCNVDLRIIQERLGAHYAEVADAGEIERLFPFCQVGAESPFGTLYGLPTLMDELLNDDAYIVFQGESYDRAISMPMAEYKRLASPRIFRFSCPGS